MKGVASPEYGAGRDAAAWLKRAGALAVCAFAVAGCEGSAADPVSWWHQLQGGRIAQDRPEPPRADAPYPNLATVPARPKTDDAAQRGSIAAGLVADRANAHYANGSNLPPLPPSSPPKQPGAPGGEMGASLAAASRPAGAPGGAASGVPGPGLPASGPAQPPLSSLYPQTPSSAPPRRAPVGKVDSAQLAAPPAPADAATPDVVMMPAVPAAPPPPPALEGVPQATVAAPPAVAPPSAPAPVVLPPGAPVEVAFADGSAVLPGGVRAQLQALAGSRAGRRILVAGYGDAPEGDQAAQSKALSLAWERAGAMSGALQAAGVPAGQLVVSARAVGKGGLARLAQ